MNRTQIFLLTVQVLMFVPVLAYLGWHLWKVRRNQKRSTTQDGPIHYSPQSGGAYAEIHDVVRSEMEKLPKPDLSN